MSGPIRNWRLGIVAMLLASLAPGCEQSRTPAALAIGDELVCEAPDCFKDVDASGSPGLSDDRKHINACKLFWDTYTGDIPPEEQLPLEALIDQRAPITNKWCVSEFWLADYE